MKSISYLILLLVFSNCSGKNSEESLQDVVEQNGKQRGTCVVNLSSDDTKVSYCVEYRDMSELQKQEVIRICSEISRGYWSELSNCSSTTQIIGLCEFTTGNIKFTYKYYFGYTPLSAKKACDDNEGHFKLKE